MTIAVWMSRQTPMSCGSFLSVSWLHQSLEKYYSAVDQYKNWGTDNSWGCQSGSSPPHKIWQSAAQSMFLIHATVFLGLWYQWQLWQHTSQVAEGPHGGIQVCICMLAYLMGAPHPSAAQ